jgi:hypothetical protein
VELLIHANKERPKATKQPKRRQNRSVQTSISDRNRRFRLTDCVDLFIDDDDDVENDFYPVGHTNETSQYFKRTTASQSAPAPFSPAEEMEGCDEFEKRTTDDLFTEMKRLRNDVLPCYHKFTLARE